jgi:hypothetical protein
VKEHDRALVARDPVAAAAARENLHRVIDERRSRRANDLAGDARHGIVCGLLASGETDPAAFEISDWLANSPLDQVSSDNDQTTNARQVVDAMLRFLEAPTGHSHAYAPQIAQACERVMRVASSVLPADLEARASHLGLVW